MARKKLSTIVEEPVDQMVMAPTPTERKRKVPELCGTGVDMPDSPEAQASNKKKVDVAPVETAPVETVTVETVPEGEEDEVMADATDEPVKHKRAMTEKKAESLKRANEARLRLKIEREYEDRRRREQEEEEKLRQKVVDILEEQTRKAKPVPTTQAPASVEQQPASGPQGQPPQPNQKQQRHQFRHHMYSMIFGVQS